MLPSLGWVFGLNASNLKSPPMSLRNALLVTDKSALKA